MESSSVAIGGQRQLESFYFLLIVCIATTMHLAPIFSCCRRGRAYGWNQWKVAKLRNLRWFVGTCACCLVVEVQFGHAVAQVGGDLETAAAINKDMKESGIHVPEAAFPEFFPTVVGILYSFTELWIPSKKVKGPQRMPAISEPQS